MRASRLGVASRSDLVQRGSSRLHVLFEVAGEEEKDQKAEAPLSDLSIGRDAVMLYGTRQQSWVPAASNPVCVRWQWSDQAVQAQEGGEDEAR
jgi:hypothetical protein